MRFDVHIFAVVRVKVANVKAASPVKAIKKAESKVDLYRLFSSREQGGRVCGCGAAETDYADELSGRLAYLVDRVRDATYARSRRFDEHLDEIRMA